MDNEWFCQQRMAMFADKSTFWGKHRIEVYSYRQSVFRQQAKQRMLNIVNYNRQQYRYEASKRGQYNV